MSDAAAKSVPEENSADKLRQDLQKFFERNPECEYRKEEKASLIARPWGDETLELRVRETDQELIAALNSVHLPPRFTAIWHGDTKDLEFIWAPIPADAEEYGRSFEFNFCDTVYRCEFAQSSNRLMLIADSSRTVRPPTPTDHRNLNEYARYRHYIKRHPESPYAAYVPTSFWIRGVDWDEDKLVDLVRHLNFFVRYFDRKSPRVIVHEGQPEGSSAPEMPIRYPYIKFPAQLIGRRLDSYLLSLWESAVNAPDPFRRFIYNYQILEYAAFYHLQEETVYSIMRVLASPQTLVQPHQAAREILDVVSNARAKEEARIVAVVQKVIDHVTIWKEIETNPVLFSEPIEFDGGFVLDALLKVGWGMEDFKKHWIPSYPDSLRKLRNALVHGRETRTAKVIAPTRQNYHRLRPWGALLAVTAVHTMLFEIQDALH